MVGIVMVLVFWKWETAFLDYLDWGFSVLFLRCKANARVKVAKSGHGPHLFRIIVFCVVLLIVLCYCLYAVLLLLCCTVIVLLCYYLCCPMYWLYVLYHCHRVLTQLQLTNISISISSFPPPYYISLYLPQVCSSSLKMEAEFYIEILVSIYPTTWSHIQSWPCSQYSPLQECQISCRVLTLVIISDRAANECVVQVWYLIYRMSQEERT